jgi:CRISPR system Cascade subunit CasD
MIDVLLLRLDAPLVSFGGVVVDQRGPTEEFPALSLLTGLLGNALGYDHRDSERLLALQERLRYGVRRDRSGVRIRDFQTVALGQDFLVDTGWTTRGVAEGRKGASGEATHIRYRDYLADAVFTVALTLDPNDPSPDVDALEAALREPERPLFLGRKPCLPAAPLLLGRLSATSLYDALRRAPPVDRGDQGPSLAAWWPDDEAGEGASRRIAVTDEMDWANQVHVGRRYVRHGRVRPEVNHAG